MPNEPGSVRVEVKLFASLRKYLPPESDGKRVVLELAEGTRVRDVLEQLRIPPGLAQLVMVNGSHETNPDRVLADGAELSIFPPVAGGRRE